MICWAIHAQRHHRDFDYVAHFNHYYRPLAASNIAIDVSKLDVSIEGYKLVIAPTFLMLNEIHAARLKTFVENGGHLVLTIRSGMKDDFNVLLPACQPGSLAEIAGVEVEDYYALLSPVSVSGPWFNGISSLWAERLKVLDASFSRGYSGVTAHQTAGSNSQTAVTSHMYGKGLVLILRGRGILMMLRRKYCSVPYCPIC